MQLPETFAKYHISCSPVENMYNFQISKSKKLMSLFHWGKMMDNSSLNSVLYLL